MSVLVFAEVSEGKFKKNALSASLNFSRDNQAKKMLGFLKQLKK